MLFRRLIMRPILRSRSSITITSRASRRFLDTWRPQEAGTPRVKPSKDKSEEPDNDRELSISREWISKWLVLGYGVILMWVNRDPLPPIDNEQLLKNSINHLKDRLRDDTSGVDKGKEVESIKRQLRWYAVFGLSGLWIGKDAVENAFQDEELLRIVKESKEMGGRKFKSKKKRDSKSVREV